MSCWVWVLRGLGQSAEIVSPVNYGPMNLECLSFLYLCVGARACPFYYFLRIFTFFSKYIFCSLSYFHMYMYLLLFDPFPMYIGS